MMRAGRVFIVPLLTCLAIVSCADAWAADHTLTTLYQELFRGSKSIHVPRTLLSVQAPATKLFEIALNNSYPLSFATFQFKDNYEFPLLTNDDDSFYYFNPPVNLAAGDGTQSNVVAITYDKRTGSIDVVTTADRDRYWRESLYGYYRRRQSETKGSMRLNLEDGWASVATTSGTESGSIMNPREVDSGSDSIFLAASVPYKSDFPYRQSGRDVELLVLSWAQGKIVSAVSLPFTDNYLPISIQTFAVQSVANQEYVYFVLRSNFTSDPTLSVPGSLRRWHVIIYDRDKDQLYSVWHGMDDSDGKKALSFSYYLGKEGLYFEVLKDGKLEVYHVDVDLTKAAPLPVYETVDLLWNNKGLKTLWESKIANAKARDPSFKAGWQ